MPKPRRNESRKDFMTRCIPYVMKEGGHKDSKKAAGKCGGIYDSYKAKAEEIRKEDEEVKENVKKAKPPVKIVQKGGLLDGQELINDADKFRELTQGSATTGDESV